MMCNDIGAQFIAPLYYWEVLIWNVISYGHTGVRRVWSTCYNKTKMFS